MTDNFKEIGSLFGREGACAGFVKQTDKESFTYAFAWPEGDTWATLTGYLNLDEQPEEYVRRVLQDGGFRSDWGNPDYDPIGDFKETAGDEYRIPLLKVLLREQLESRYEVANHFSTMNRARVELSAFIQSEGGAPLPEDALGTPEELGIRAMLIATGEPPREVTLLPDKNGSINHLPAIRRISLKASLTSRLIDFKYLREAEPAAEVPAGTRWVPSDAADYGFDDDDDDISAFSFPEA